MQPLRTSPIGGKKITVVHGFAAKVYYSRLLRLSPAPTETAQRKITIHFKQGVF
jgi:hypothetical protein